MNSLNILLVMCFVLSFLFLLWFGIEWMLFGHWHYLQHTSLIFV